jgi:hypothetical protein
MQIATPDITLTSIILSTFLPVLFGVLGYFLTSFWISPVIEFRKLKERVVSDFIFYADVLNSSGEEHLKRSKSSEALRRHAADLRAINNTLVGWSVFRKLMRLPKSELIDDTSSHLVGMSHAVYSKMNNEGYDEVALCERMKSIQDNLQIKFHKDIEKRLQGAKEFHETRPRK